MDLNQYYKITKEIGEEVKVQDSSILDALNYDSENDHPSQWVPKVQQALLVFYKKFPDAEKADEILKLYVHGEILENRADRSIVLKTGFTCLLLGIAIGWFLWG